MEGDVLKTDVLKTDDEIEGEFVPTQTAVAKRFNVSQVAVCKWEKEPDFPVKERRGYDLIKIASWKAGRPLRKANKLLLEKTGKFDVKLIEEVKEGLLKFQDLGEFYKEKRGEIFSGIGAKILSTSEQILDGITANQLKNMNVRDKLKALKDLITSATSIYEKERLENDQSTSNLQIIVAQIKDLKRREAEKRMVQDGNPSN